MFGIYNMGVWLRRARKCSVYLLVVFQQIGYQVYMFSAGLLLAFSFLANNEKPSHD